MLSDDDQFIIRSESNGSMIRERYTFKIKYDITDEIIAVATLE